MKTMLRKLSPGEYRYLKAELSGHLRKKGVSAPEADDIIQESIYKFLVSSASIPAEKTKCYLQKIASNTYIDSIRERARYVDFNEDLNTLADHDWRLETRQKINVELVTQMLHDEEDGTAAMRAFKSFYLNNKKLNVIASEQSVPLGTVTSWVKRTRDRSVIRIKQKIEAMDLDFVGNHPLVFNK